MPCCVGCSVSIPLSATERESDKQAEMLGCGWICYWFWGKEKKTLCGAFALLQHQ